MASIREIQIDNATYDIKATHYATCSTAAGTAAKVATVQNGSFTLEAGSRVAIKFTYANSAASATLNVNNTGAKTIYWNGAALTSTQYWAAGQVVDFIYDGSYWHMVSTVKDNDTNTKMSVYRQDSSTYNGDYPLIASRTKAADLGTVGTESSKEAVYGLISDTDANIPTVNPYTGLVKVKNLQAESYEGSLIWNTF